MKNKILTVFITIIFYNHSFSQEKINADVSIMNFLDRIPQKVESNALPDNIINILYFDIQPDSFPKIGYLDKKGKVLIQPKYNMGLDFYGSNANIIKDSVFGYINKNGDETLFNQFERTFFYYGNTGIAKKNGKYGLIDRNGNSLTDFEYPIIRLFGSNHFMLYNEDKKGKISDSKGNIIFNEKLVFDVESHYFESDSLLVYQEVIDGKKLSGLVNLEEKIILKPRYENIYFINDKEYYAVNKDNKWGFINKAGIEVIPLIYDEVGLTINDNLIPVKKIDKWGFISRKNETVIPFMYDEAYAFSEGLAFVKKEEKYGCIDRRNRTIVDFNLEKTNFPFFTNKMALFKKGNKYGFIDKKGRVTIPPIYDQAFPFVNGLAYVDLSGKVGYIDKKGEVIIPIKYNQLWFESEGIIRFAE